MKGGLAYDLTNRLPNFLAILGDRIANYQSRGRFDKPRRPFKTDRFPRRRVWVQRFWPLGAVSRSVVAVRRMDRGASVFSDQPRFRSPDFPHLVSLSLTRYTVALHSERPMSLLVGIWRIRFIIST